MCRRMPRTVAAQHICGSCNRAADINTLDAPCLPSVFRQEIVVAQARRTEIHSTHIDVSESFSVAPLSW